MSFLNALVPLMRGNASLQIVVKPVDGQLRFVVIPTLDQLDPETNEPALGNLQAALSRPFVFTAAMDADLDAAASTALRDLAAARSDALDALAEYRQSMAEATEKAKSEAASKAKSPPKPASPSKSGAGAATKVGEVAAKAPGDAADPKPSAPKPKTDPEKLAADLF